MSTVVEVLNMAVPKKLMALEMAIASAMDDIPEGHRATAQFDLQRTDDGIRFRVWYDADAEPVVPAGTAAPKKRAWWKVWRKAA